MTIRSAGSADLPGLARAYVDSGRHHAAIDPLIHRVPSEAGAIERVQAKLADPETSVFVAEEAGEVVGLLEIRLVARPPAGAILQSPPAAHVGLSVREAWRDRGIGSSLMAFAERWAIERGCRLMTLDLSSLNTGALRLYERLGYETYGLLMRKPLPGYAVQPAAARSRARTNGGSSAARSQPARGPFVRPRKAT